MTGLVSHLDNVIQSYAWGSRHALARLQNRPSAEGPEAELWMGAHPKAPSRLDNGKTLLEHIASNPAAALGPSAAERFHQKLPFLLKVLAAEQVLSLQVHPTKAQAEAGFARERSQHPAPGLYSDASDKPELLCALTPFEVLCGFRTIEASSRLFDSHGLKDLALALERSSIRMVFEQILNAEFSKRQRWIETALSHSGPESALLLTLSQSYPGDAGVVAALLLNHFVVPPEQAIFLPAGRLHAYVCGMGIELMANSDNVLRGGLTPKKIDVKALLSIVDFGAQPIELLQASGEGERVFRTPSVGFQLSVIDLKGKCSVERTGPDIVLAVDGPCQVLGETGRCVLEKGQSAFADFSAGRLTLSGQGRVFRATTP